MSNNPYQNPYSTPPQPSGPPNYAGGRPPGGAPPKPENYLIHSILLLICCAGLLAVPAIVFAAQVDSKYNQGDYHGAAEASKNAKTWCIVALSVGLLCQGLGAAFYIFMIAAGAANGL